MDQPHSLPNTAPDKDSEDQYGYSISQSESFIAISAIHADADGLTSAGAVYLYQLEDNGSVTYIAKVTAPDKSPHDLFGSDLSLRQSSGSGQ